MHIGFSSIFYSTHKKQRKDKEKIHEFKPDISFTNQVKN